MTKSPTTGKPGAGLAYYRRAHSQEAQKTPLTTPHDIVKDWLSIRRRNFKTSKRTGIKKKRERISFYEDALEKISSEVQAWLIKRARLGDEIPMLKAEREAIRRSGNIVGINPRTSN